MSGSSGTFLTWRMLGLLLLIVFLVILGYYTFILLNTLTMVIMLGIVAILVYIFTLHLWRNRR